MAKSVEVTLRRVAQTLYAKRDTRLQLPDLTREQAYAATKEVLAIIKGCLVSGQEVNLRGFGAFRLRPIGARKVVPPYRNKAVLVPPHLRISFKPSQSLREAAKTHQGEHDEYC